MTLKKSLFKRSLFKKLTKKWPEVWTSRILQIKDAEDLELPVGRCLKYVSTKLREKSSFYVFDLFDRCDLDLRPIT